MQTRPHALQNIDALSYAWIGSGTINEEAYKRIQSPDLLIEMMSMVSGMADGANGHYHTIIRNPSRDYSVFDD